MLPVRKKFKWNKDSSIIKRHHDLRDVFTWTSSNGRITPLPEMDSNHIKNALAKFERGESNCTDSEVLYLRRESMYREIYKINKIEKKIKNGKRTLEGLSGKHLQ